MAMVKISEMVTMMEEKPIALRSANTLISILFLTITNASNQVCQLVLLHVAAVSP